MAVSVGRPQTIHWQGRAIRTAFLKTPQSGPVRVLAESLEGDGQADLRYHGGPTMAAYAYPAEHYDDWRLALDLPGLPWGSFGENLTIHGFLETEVREGDEFEIGTARLRVTKPRMPCHKLNARFQRSDALKRFLVAAKPGFYLSVVRPGLVAAGDGMHRALTDDERPTIHELFLQRARRSREG